VKIILLMHYLYAFKAPLGGGHGHVNANELAGLGAGAAALIGVIGYLVLRRRNSSGK
jgi:hypothetical protein